MEENDKRIEDVGEVQPQEGGVPPAAVTSSRQAFVDRVKKRHPDLDDSDEEGFYSAVNADYDEDSEGRDELERYRKEDQELKEAFGRDKRLANVFMGFVRGDNVLEYLVDEFGSDFLDYLNDPDNEEIRENIAEKQKAWLEKQAKSKELNEQAEANLDKSLDAFDAVAKEMGADENTQEEAFRRYIEFQEKCIVNNVDEDMWRLFFKGTSYDGDVEQAGIEGEVRGRNAKIRERLRNNERDPMASGGAAAPAPGKPRPKTIFDLANEAN